MATLTQKFGQFVQRRRKQLGMSQIEFSKKLFNSTNQSYVSELERGLRNNIELNTIERILDVLDADFEFKPRE